MFLNNVDISGLGVDIGFFSDSMFDYQVEAARKVVNTLEGRGRDFLAMATGLRKTRVAIETIENVSRRPNKILILADKKDCWSSIKPPFQHHFGDEYATSDFTGKKFIQGADRNRKEIVFATRQSMRNYIDEENSKTKLFIAWFF
jgi:type I site-specific restriction endonuclease